MLRVLVNATRNFRGFGVSCKKISTMGAKVETVNLTKDVKMPLLGLGSWQAKDDELEKAIDAALEAGYRHIDTAYVYENEKVIGKVISKWISSGKLKREELFLVTKLPPSGNRPEAVSKFLKRSLENLQVSYLDLYLIHTPFAFKDIEGDLHPIKDGKIDFDPITDHVAIWKEMEKQVEAGLAKAIGISNFNVRQIQRILDNARIPPANLQIELHAYHQQKELVEFCKKNGIVVTAYSPLGSPGLPKFMEQFGKKLEIPNIMTNPVVQEIAKKHNKTVAQVLLRQIVQKGIAAIPKSTNPERLQQNLNVFDFTLDADDMKKMDGLDKGPAARILDFTVFPGIEAHPEYPFK